MVYGQRRDNRGRLLHVGETQTKDGRYRYKYTDTDGKTCVAYSWRLTHSDSTPKGKRPCPALRDIEREVMKNRLDGICCKGEYSTVYELVEKYVSLKTGVRHSTQAGYQTLLKLLATDPFDFPLKSIIYDNSKRRLALYYII